MTTEGECLLAAPCSEVSTDHQPSQSKEKGCISDYSRVSMHGASNCEIAAQQAKGQSTTGVTLSTTKWLSIAGTDPEVVWQTRGHKRVNQDGVSARAQLLTPNPTLTLTQLNTSWAGSISSSRQAEHCASSKPMQHSILIGKLHAWILPLMLLSMMMPYAAEGQGTTEAGKVVAWGQDRQFGVTFVPVEIAQEDVVGISAASGFNLVLLSNGRVFAWGDNSDNETDVPESIQGNVIAVDGGGAHGIALLSNGSVVAWGANDYNQTSVPDSIQGHVAAISAGEVYSMALLKNGTITGWGLDVDNRLTAPDNTMQGNFIAISAGSFHNVALLSNGTVVAWGAAYTTNQTIFVPSNATYDVTAVSAGRWHSLALLNTGEVVAWGDNSNGQCDVPVEIQGAVKAISAGSSHSLALLIDGTVVVWGDIGIGTTNGDTFPDSLQGSVIAVSAGYEHSLAIVASTPSLQPPSPPDVSPPPPSTLPPPPPIASQPPPSPNPLVPSPSDIPAGSSPPIPSPSHFSNSVPPPLALQPSPPDASHHIIPPAPPVDPPSAVPASVTSSHSSTAAVAAGVAVGAAACLAVVAAVLLWKKHRKPTILGAHVAGNGGDPNSEDNSMPALATIVIKPDMETGPASNIKHHSSSSQQSQIKSSGVVGATTDSDEGLPAMSSRFTAAGGLGVTAVVQKRVLGTLNISWADIEVGEQLGQGGFGTVYLGAWQGNRVAVKMLNKEHLSQEARAALHHEVLMMCELRHPCIAPAYGLVDEGEHHALVMRYYKRGTLAAAMRTSAYEQLDLVPRLKIALQVATGIRRLHEAQPSPIIHGDLKTSNILLDDDGSWRVVVTDFGLACSVRTSGHGGSAGSRTTVGLTVSNSPPEVLVDPCAPRTLAVDSYAFAIVLLEIVQGEPLYRGMRPQEVINAVKLGNRAAISSSAPNDVSALVQACWAQDPGARPGFKVITERLRQSIDEHSCASTHGHDYLKTTITRINSTSAWY